MLHTDTEGRVAPECDLTAPGIVQRSRDWSGGHHHVRGVAAYYRLRSLALEARIATLEAELDRTERRLQETIARYEEILQRRPTDDCVVTTQPCADD